MSIVCIFLYKDQKQYCWCILSTPDTDAHQKSKSFLNIDSLKICQINVYIKFCKNWWTEIILKRIWYFFTYAYSSRGFNITIISYKFACTISWYILETYIRNWKLTCIFYTLVTYIYFYARYKKFLSLTYCYCMCILQFNLYET